VVRLHLLASAPLVLAEDPGGAESVHAVECVQATKILSAFEAITFGCYVHLHVVFPSFAMRRHLDAFPDFEELFLQVSAGLDILTELLGLETGIVRSQRCQA